MTRQGIDDAPLSRSTLWFAIAVFAVGWVWIAVTTRGWDDKWLFLAVLGVVGVLIAGLFLSWRHSIPRLSGRWSRTRDPAIRDHWATPANRAELNRRLVADLEYISAATLLLLTVVVLVLGSTSGAPPQMWSLALPIALFVAGVLAYVLYMVLSPRYRPPAP